MNGYRFTLDELDWIPFKFVDTRLKDDKGGGSMVFRYT